ncbi:MAG: GTPase [Alphaproteobacteria bacterium]|nr:GTPase [Alphaproteobacteria bacterium]MBV8547989.1 GTPase [Alphaproteobacteria bacterium]
MRLKSFHGANITDAMRQVREALGEDAIIVATREDDTGGVRVTAAIDDVPVEEAQLAEEKQTEGQGALEVIAESLTRHQVPAYLSEKLMAAATQFANDDPLLTLGAALDTHFKFQPAYDEKSTKPLILVGPPGVGKTLCIAKFATQATLAKKQIAVISTDIERAGGMEQLAAFTRLLKIDLMQIEDAHALADAVALHKGKPIFIDTPGRNPFDPVEAKQIQDLVAAAGGETALVLTAGHDASEAVDLAHAFGKIGARRLIVSRIEMMRRSGSLLRLAHEGRLPLSAYSASSKVIDPLLPFNPVSLARLILPKPAPAQEKPATKKKSAS